MFKNEYGLNLDKLEARLEAELQAILKAELINSKLNSPDEMRKRMKE